ncbi:MAG: penicillin-binding protein 2 [Candidatus Buchananbacteria bacterium]|nr:penicillin-binding protein 2 [Candidatus Buchananbacteria bacterium]
MSWRENKLIRFRTREGKQGRIKFLAVFFVIFSILIIIKLFYLQIFRGSFYEALAIGQHELYQKLFPERGSIYVVEKNGDKQILFPLVTNKDLHMLYAIPKDIENPRQTAEKLFALFGLPDNIDMKKVEAELFSDITPDMDPAMSSEIKKARLDKWQEEQKEKEIARLEGLLSKPDDPYEPIRHKLKNEDLEIIKSWNIKGLDFKDETWRFYPEKGMGGHIFGFWGFEGDNKVGKYGLEGYFDKELTGQFGAIQGEKDGLGNLIAIGSSSLKEKVDGSSLVLTIDRAIQYKACQALSQAVDYFKAESGSVIVMNPKTGAILAMCGAPDYDPDEYNQVEDIEVYNNQAIFSAYEPGSIFKAITMSIALDTGKVEPNTTYVDEGGVQIGPYLIKNYNDLVYGKQTMTEVLEKSINTGSIFAVNRITPKVFSQYVKDFGFGQKTGIELNKEASGDISNLDKKGEIYAATASFGQGLTVTPIQMITAVSALANGGKLMKPYIVSQIIKSDGKIETFKSQEVKQVISSKTSSTISGMLVSVIENGHSKGAKIDGYRIAGKTGTAQVANKSNKGYSDAVNTSFISYGPFSNPVYVMMVRIDKPQWGKTGEAVAVPVATDIAKFILQYYNVPYDNK